MIDDFLETVAHNAFLSICFCWTIISFSIIIFLLFLGVI